MIADVGATLRLLQAFDSAFPSGAFAFSGGLEALSAAGVLTGGAALEAFLACQVVARFGGIDRTFIARAHRVAPDVAALSAVDAACEGFVSVAEAGEASRRTGLSLMTTHARIGTPGIAPFRAAVAGGLTPGHASVVQGLVGRSLGLSVAATEAGALHGAVQSCLAAAIRLGRVGALEAQAILISVRPAMEAALSGEAPDEPAAFVPVADIALSRHDDHAGRLFAS